MTFTSIQEGVSMHCKAVRGQRLMRLNSLSRRLRHGGTRTCLLKLTRKKFGLRSWPFGENDAPAPRCQAAESLADVSQRKEKAFLMRLTQDLWGFVEQSRLLYSSRSRLRLIHSDEMMHAMGKPLAVYFSPPTKSPPPRVDRRLPRRRPGRPAQLTYISWR